MKANWGECFLDHYERFLGARGGGDVFTLDTQEHSIQALHFDNVFPGCRTYATIGFSHFASEIHDSYDEVVMAADAGFDSIPKLLASTLFYLAEYRVPVSAGLSKGGLHDLDRDFVERFQEDAIYFTTPFPLPPEFKTIQCGDATGLMYLAVLISEQEHRYISSHGADRFEQRMEDAGVDPFSIDRPSIV